MQKEQLQSACRTRLIWVFSHEKRVLRGMGEVIEKEQNTIAGVPLTREQVLEDYRVAVQSRQASLLGRKEVLTGKAKFGIFGDGKEVAQLAMARAFQKGDIRSGYYRDQTFMFALGISNVQEFFAQVYAHTDVDHEPASAGRSMNGHFATRSLNPDGSWKNMTEMYNSSADISPTGSQMPRLVGLAYASKLYRKLEDLQSFSNFSNNGNEVAWGTIGNASCAEGMFWETVNAIGVLESPAIISIWDDGYGISVPNKYQVTKDNVGEILAGFQRKSKDESGYEIFTVKAWDYPALLETYYKASEVARKEHTPVIIHVTEVTQPQGHSTSGSHERYKSKERLAWEIEADCIKRMREWMESTGEFEAEELNKLEKAEKKNVSGWKKEAWKNYTAPIKQNIKTVSEILDRLANTSTNGESVKAIAQKLSDSLDPYLSDVMIAISQALIATRNENLPERDELIAWRNQEEVINHDRYSSYLYNETGGSALEVPEVKPVFSDNSDVKNGFQILNDFFDLSLEKYPNLIAFGEDVGYLGDVNQAFAGMQEKYGELRVTDTGIRECTILGQAIGMAMRGLRPIAEIQYLDYLLYALQIMSDDLATVQYRTKGGQMAPAIIRTRGHRLEGIWHSGSPMAGIINLVRGIRVCVPRNMVQAAGMYNTLLQSEEPGLIVEVLNGYRLKETRPDNLGEFTIPLGVPEILREGTDITLVTYGACCRVAEKAAEMLEEVGISVELIDVQTLLPFDINHIIVESLKKTNRIVFLDEDVPGGTSAYMLQKVIEEQKGYFYLDSEARTIAAKAHRPAYGSDGDYWSKPNAEHIFEFIYEMMNEFDPEKFPIFFK